MKKELFYLATASLRALPALKTGVREAGMVIAIIINVYRNIRNIQVRNLKELKF